MRGFLLWYEKTMHETRGMDVDMWQKSLSSAVILAVTAPIRRLSAKGVKEPAGLFPQKCVRNFICGVG